MMCNLGDLKRSQRIQEIVDVFEVNLSAANESPVPLLPGSGSM